MFDKLKSLFAAAQLPPVAPLKVKPGQRSWPAYFSTTKTSTEKITRPDRRLINTDVLTYRAGSSTYKVLQDMVASNPELSNAVYSAVRLGVPERFTAIARGMDGTIDEAGTAILQQLIARFNVVGDPLEGYVGSNSLKSISESLARDLTMYGTMACELVLDKSRLPYRLQHMSATTIEYRYDKNGTRPFQKVGEDEIDLDTPTVAIIQLDSDGLSPYSTSPIEPALRAVIFNEQFMNDLLRVMRKAVHPRVVVTIDEERVRKHLSPEAQIDGEKATAELNSIISGIENKLNSLNPEDALVILDSLGVTAETPPALDGNYGILRDIANARLASGSKTLPSVLGLETGGSSSNIASTQAASYILAMDSSIRQKLNEMYSRLFTMAIRLMGVDGYVVFEYEHLTIRNKTETVAFEQTRNGMVLDLLSTGMLSDVEACLMLTGKLPPAGYKPLSGTMFRSSSQTQQPDDNPNGESNSGSTVNQKIKSDAPSVGRGQNTNKNSGKKAEDFVAPNITLNVDNTHKAPTASVLKLRRDEDGNLEIVKQVPSVKTSRDAAGDMLVGDIHAA